MKSKKVISLSISVIIILLFIGFFTVPIQVQPYADTRMILEHSHQTYIAPPCYQQAETTNNIQEPTLGQIKENFKPESTCTEQALQSQKKVLFDVVREKLGLKDHEWNW